MSKSICIQDMGNESFYTHSTLKIEIQGVASIALKSPDSDVLIFGVDELVDTSAITPDKYKVQFYNADDEVVGNADWEFKMNLKYAGADYNPLSRAQMALQAINAFIEGRATAVQRQITIGDKSIEYSSYSELMSWKRYFEKQVARQHGKPTGIRNEYIKVRGI